jgi:hypothetical protein
LANGVNYICLGQVYENCILANTIAKYVSANRSNSVLTNNIYALRERLFLFWPIYQYVAQPM